MHALTCTLTRASAYIKVVASYVAMYMSMQVTANHADALAVGQTSAKQGRFICELCNIHFYHATALVSHYEEKHDKMLRGCL